MSGGLNIKFIGPECFTDERETVISYKGENYYKKGHLPAPEELILHFNEGEGAMNEEQAAREAMDKPGMDVEDVIQTRLPSSNSIMRYFEYSHLPEKLADISNLFADLAMTLDEILPDGPEKSTALRKLLESKDAGVRSALDLP